MRNNLWGAWNGAAARGASFLFMLTKHSFSFFILIEPSTIYLRLHKKINIVKTANFTPILSTGQPCLSRSCLPRSSCHPRRSPLSSTFTMEGEEDAAPAQHKWRYGPQDMGIRLSFSWFVWTQQGWQFNLERCSS